jgi:hypothetical protein
MSEAKETDRPLPVMSLPSEWDRLPDIGLYMDQVVTYLERELETPKAPGGERIATPSMINNYAKAGIIPRAEGKKYSRPHIAILLSAFTLKQVLSIQDMSSLMAGLGGQVETKAFYESFRQTMDQAAGEMATTVETGIRTAGEGGIGRKEACLALALKLAVEASLRSFAAEILLGETRELAREEEPRTEKPSRKKQGRRNGQA